MLERLLPVGLAILTVCIANYTDLFKGRIIPNKLTLPMIATGIVFHALVGIWNLNPFQAISGAVGAFVAFAIAYGIWLMGWWAGGDVKLFTALGALLPMYSPRTIPAPYSSDYPLFPLTILLNGIIAMIPISLAHVAICYTRGKGAFYESVKITELREGMIPAETIYEKGGKIERWSSRFGLGPKPRWDRTFTYPRRAAGLTRYQVGVLKRFAREGRIENHLKIKRGIPFAPALGLGVFISVFYGDLYWGLIRALSGA